MISARIDLLAECWRVKQSRKKMSAVGTHFSSLIVLPDNISSLILLAFSYYFLLFWYTTANLDLNVATPHNCIVNTAQTSCASTSFPIITLLDITRSISSSGGAKGVKELITATSLSPSNLGEYVVGHQRRTNVVFC